MRTASHARDSAPITREGVLAEMRDRLYRRTDRLFLRLLVVAWSAAIGFALAPAGAHVPVALALVVDGCAVAVLARRPATPLARHMVASALACWCVLSAVLFDGHRGSELVVFGLLASLAMYRDWTVLVSATCVFAAGAFAFAAPWQAAEWIAWVGGGSTVLALVSVRDHQTMLDAATREATLQQTAASVSRKVENRTRALAEAVERYRALVENTEAIPFEFDMAEHRVIYIPPQAERLFECSVDEIHEVGFFLRIAHPDDQAEAAKAFLEFMAGRRAASEPIDHRLVTRSGRVVHVRTFLSHCVGTRVRGITLDMTRQIVLETELRQAQKLESVGRLAAGVAHEINTPIQFIGDSLLFVQETMGGLFDVIQAQRAALADDSPARLNELADVVERADLDFLEGEVPRSIQRALDGVERVASIVRTMKAFAHPDQARVLECDLRQAIESSLTMARNEYKYIADVVTHYDDLPRVRCRAGEINQVLLNIIVNAAHAIAQAVGGTGRRGTITISLRREQEWALISIGDTGIGIPEHARDHVFEPFYTTKPVGKGTGQGLSLARAVIVDRHAGTIGFETATGIGTTFHLRIPLEHRRAAAA